MIMFFLNTIVICFRLDMCLGKKICGVVTFTISFIFFILILLSFALPNWYTKDPSFNVGVFRACDLNITIDLDNVINNIMDCETYKWDNLTSKLWLKQNLNVLYHVFYKKILQNIHYYFSSAYAGCLGVWFAFCTLRHDMLYQCNSGLLL